MTPWEESSNHIAADGCAYCTMDGMMISSPIATRCKACPEEGGAAVISKGHLRPTWEGPVWFIYTDSTLTIWPSYHW